jgi:uncharacterized protein (DUF362 family)
MNRVALVKASEGIDGAVRRAVGLAGGIVIKPGMKVVIKPNVCNAKNPHGMVITDFGIVESAVRMVREAGCEPLVVESDNIADTGDNRVRGSGLMARLDEWGVRFLNLSTDECTPKQVAGTEIMVPNTMLEADYVINLAKIKTCSHTLVTLSIKNLFGCFKEAKKSRLHKRLDDVLPFLAKTIRSDMNIVDGLVCMEGNGPVVGNPKELGVIVAGTNPVSVDSFCSTLMGFDAKEIRHITNAEALGVGLLQFEAVGDPLEGSACKFERPYSLKANIKSLGAVKDVYLTR